MVGAKVRIVYRKGERVRIALEHGKPIDAPVVLAVEPAAHVVIDLHPIEMPSQGIEKRVSAPLRVSEDQERMLLTGGLDGVHESHLGSDPLGSAETYHVQVLVLVVIPVQFHPVEPEQGGRPPACKVRRNSVVGRKEEVVAGRGVQFSEFAVVLAPIGCSGVDVRVALVPLPRRIVAKRL